MPLKAIINTESKTMLRIRLLISSKLDKTIASNNNPIIELIVSHLTGIG
jgi:hypothetical protein